MWKQDYMERVYGNDNYSSDDDRRYDYNDFDEDPRLDYDSDGLWPLSDEYKEPEMTQEILKDFFNSIESLDTEKVRFFLRNHNDILTLRDNNDNMAFDYLFKDFDKKSKEDILSIAEILAYFNIYHKINIFDDNCVLSINNKDSNGKHFVERFIDSAFELPAQDIKKALVKRLNILKKSFNINNKEWNTEHLQDLKQKMQSYNKINTNDQSKAQVNVDSSEAPKMPEQVAGDKVITKPKSFSELITSRSYNITIPTTRRRANTEIVEKPTSTGPNIGVSF